ncbi:MAG: hypothetical protein J0L81_18120 [Caulobacterales bacterium]|jgi:hypothetical protein|nr:hypothetical protein [Caulobacterales bacterium]
MKTITIAVLAACLGATPAMAETAPQRAAEIDAARITQVMERHFTLALARDGQHQALAESRAVLADLNRDLDNRRGAQAYAAAPAPAQTGR